MLFLLQCKHLDWLCDFVTNRSSLLHSRLSLVLVAINRNESAVLFFWLIKLNVLTLTTFRLMIAETGLSFAASISLHDLYRTGAHRTQLVLSQGDQLALFGLANVPKS